MKAREVVYQSYLYVVAFALLAVGAISLGGHLYAEHSILHAAVVMPPGGMLCFFLLGMTLIAATRRYVAALRANAALLLGLALFSLLHHYLSNPESHTSWLVDLVRVPGTLIPIVILLTFGILLGLGPKTARRFGQAIGVLVVVLFGLTSQLTGWWSALGFSYLDAMHVSTILPNVLAVLLGIAVIVLGQLPGEHERGVDRLTLTTGAIGVLFTCLSWYLLNLQTIESISRESDLLLTRVQNATERDLRERSVSIRRMAERWQVAGVLPTQALWRDEIKSHLRDSPALTAVALLDADMRPTWLESRNEVEPRWLEQFIAEPERRKWLQGVQQVNLSDMSHPRGLTLYHDQLIVAVPLQLPTLQGGLVVARLDMKEMLDRLLGQDLSGFDVHVFVGDELIFDSQHDSNRHTHAPITERNIPLRQDLHLRLEAFVVGPNDLHAFTLLPSLVLLFGLSLSCMLMLSQRLASLRAQDQERLQESEERFKCLYTFNPDAVFSFDLAGKFEGMNSAALALTGRSEAESAGHHFAVVVIEKDLPHTQRHFAAACAGEPQRYEASVRDKQGAVRLLDITNLPIVVGKQIVGVFGIAKDISERQRFTAALHKSLQRTERKAEQLRGLSAAAIATASLRDNQQLVDYLVSQARLLIGAHQSMMVIGQADDLAQPVHAMSLSEKYAAWHELSAAECISIIHMLAWETGAPVRRSQAELEADPRWRNFISQSENCLPLRGCLAMPLIDKRGRRIGVFQLSDKDSGEFDEDDQAIAQQFAQMAIAALETNSLVEQVLAGEKQLQTQLDLTSTITASMVEGLLATDTHGRLAFINPAAQSLIGLPAERVVGLPLGDLLPLKYEEWQLTSESDCGERGEFRLISGEELTLQYDARPMFAADGHSGWVIAIRDVSAERRANQALLERNQFFSLSLEMFCMVDLDGRFVQVNPTFAKVLLFPVAALVGHPYLDLVHPADRDLLQTAVKRLRYGELVEDLQVRVLDSLSREHWLQFSAALGEDEVIYCVARDITERRAINEQMRQSNMLLSMAGRSAKLGGWDLDVPSNRLIWSDEMREILGYPPGTTPSMEDGLKLCAKPDRALLDESVRACAELGQSFDIDVGFHRANGDLIDARVAGQPIMDSIGRIVRVVGAFQDISERKQAQRETIRLAERLATTMESISDGFHTLDNDWRITYMNGESARLLGVQVADVLGTEVWASFPGSRESEVGEHFLEAVESKEAKHFDTFYEPLGLWLEVHAYPSEEGLAVYFQDISARKRTEEELHSTLQELERSNRELEEFAFVASHDLQEPLRKIQSFSERLAARAVNLDDDGRDYLQRMTSAAARMQALIIDLLDYSRVNTRGEAFQRVELNEIVKESLQDLEATLEQAQAQVEFAKLPHVMGDSSQLRRIIQNLLSNAVKFQKPGTRPQIHIYAERARTNAWTLCIEDNGIGFDEKYLDRIFNPFQRLHGREAYAGTGIGLAIVKKIAERHGASITANSSPGKGSVFRITFPVHDEASA